MSETKTQGVGRAARSGVAGYVVVGVVAALTIAFSLLRLRFGVNPTDEALHIALPWRFALGAVPVADEWSLAQFAGLLATPFVQAYVSLTGSTDGLVAAWRVGFVVLQLITMLVATRFFRRFVSGPLSVLLALPIVALVPWGAPTLGYNTLGSSFLAMGLLAGYPLFVDEPKMGRLLAVGVLHGIAIFAYPTLAPLALVYALLLWRNWKHDRGARSLLYLLSAWSGIGVSGLLALAAGIDSIKAMGKWMLSIGNQAGGLTKLADIGADFVWNLPGQSLMLAAVAVILMSVGLSGGRHRSMPLLALAFAPLLTAPLSGFPEASASMGFVLYYTLLGMAVIAWLRHDEVVRPLVLGVQVPSLVAALLFAYSSNNGLLNAPLGMVASFCAAQVAVALALGRLAEPKGDRWDRVASAARWLSPVLAVLVMSAVAFAGVYGEPELGKLTSTIDSGPYRGMRTTPQMQAHMRLLQETVDEHVRADDRVLFFDDLAAGYLFTSATPATNSPWSFNGVKQPGVYADEVAGYYTDGHALPTVVVQQLKRPYMGLRYADDHPFVKILEDGAYEKISDDGVFAVYRLVE